MALAVLAPLALTACVGMSADDTGDATGSAGADLFTGIPQDGIELGDPRAPITVTEFVDLQCGHCRHYALDVLPTVVEGYVRTNRVKLILRNLAFLGPSSKRAARTAAAVGLQGQLWQFVECFFQTQEEHRMIAASDAGLRSVVAALDGVDVDQAMAARDDPAVARQLADARAEADRFGIHSAPSFLVSKPGGEPRRLRLRSRAPEVFTHDLDDLIREVRAAP